MKQKEPGLDFEVDKLTKSIENVVTGESFATEISILPDHDLVQKRVKRKDGNSIGGTSSKNIL